MSLLAHCEYNSPNGFLMMDLMKKIRARTSSLIDLLARIRNWLSGLRFPPGWEKGAIIAVGILIVVYAGYFGYVSQSGYGRLVDISVSVLVAGIGYLVFLSLGSTFVRFLVRFPPVVWTLILAGFLIGGQVWGSRTWLHWFFNLALVLCAALIGSGIMALVRLDWRSAKKRPKFLSVVFIFVGVAGFIWMGWMIFTPGHPAQPLAVQVIHETPLVDAPDPSRPGNYSVKTLTYGSGTDRRRPEFADEVDLLTESVNAAAYVNFREKMPDGLPEFMLDWKLTETLFARFSEISRQTYWGFGVSDLPLNGRVWYPEGEGPFPLVLIVHGNHNMVDFSDTGYGYLGELLASRGFIFVSVDENFLNGGYWGRSSGENDARAWLLLKHLEVWENWNQDPGSPFYQKADLSEIALIGHSRGGEAAALAATFNQLSRYPNNARISWDFDFNIRSVVAISPVDESWQPADHPNPLTDVNYLVLQGSHDGDVYYFDGIQQYNRAAFSGSDSELFKAAVYIYRANHGLFNSSWGATDKSGIAGVFLNRAALLSEAQQQQIAKLFISAFLEATLKGDMAYREIFEDYRTAGSWLPQTGYISQYEDLGIWHVANFEEDVDVTTNSLPGGRIETQSLDRWNELAIRFRNSNRQDNHVVRVGWGTPSAYFALTNPNSIELNLSLESVLVFKAADARSPDGVTDGLDFSILLEDRVGRIAKLPISSVIPLQTQFPAKISKLPLWNASYYKEVSEEVFQTYRIPLEDFLAVNPSLDVTEIKQIRFEFDRTPKGIVYLDEIGFDLIP